jgi:hypothetical protein
VWFVRDGWGQQRGPLSEKELTHHLIAGRVGTDCVVWQHGWPTWQPILSYFQLPPPAPVYQFPVYTRRPQQGMSGITWAAIIIGGLVVSCCLFSQFNRHPDPVIQGPSPSLPRASFVLKGGAASRTTRSAPSSGRRTRRTTRSTIILARRSSRSG